MALNNLSCSTWDQMIAKTRLLGTKIQFHQSGLTPNSEHIFSIIEHKKLNLLEKFKIWRMHTVREWHQIQNRHSTSNNETILTMHWIRAKNQLSIWSIERWMTRRDNVALLILAEIRLWRVVGLQEISSKAPTVLIKIHWF